MPRSAAVFCGSRFGARPEYRQAASDLGQGLANAKIKLIYGGGYVGLMGAVADATLSAGGKVTGIIPEFLKSREVMHESVQELIVTDSMHVRKQMMFARAGAFIIMPGGLGTFDEMMEIMTWKQLRLHDKPIIIVNILGWADPVIATIDSAIEDGFAEHTVRNLFEVVPDIPSTLARLNNLPSAEEDDTNDSDTSRL